MNIELLKSYLGNVNYIAQNNRMNNEQWIGKYVEGVMTHFKVLPQHSPVRTEKTTKNLSG
jgi:hypothetical protein